MWTTQARCPHAHSDNNKSSRRFKNWAKIYPLDHAMKHNFYTFFNRQTIDCGSSSSEERPLEPDFNDPNPNPPVQMDFYRFTLPKAGPVKLFNAGSWIGSHGPTYIIQPSNSNPAVWSDKQTLDLEGGTYLLKVLDQLTQASGGASNPIFRDPHAENIEPYQFELLYEP
jgi:hypothetical protein